MSGSIVCRDGLAAHSKGTDLVLLAADGSEQARLDQERAALWFACQDASDVDRLAREVSDRTGARTSVDRIFDLLDEFADLGLIVRRVAPPASPKGIARRGFLGRTLAIGIGVLAAGTSTMAMAMTEEERIKSDGEKDAKKEAETLQRLEEKALREAAKDLEHQEKDQKHQEESQK